LLHLVGSSILLYLQMRNLRFRRLRSSRMLHSVFCSRYRRFETAYLSPPQGSIDPCLDPCRWTNRASRNISSYQSTLRNIPEEWRP